MPSASRRRKPILEGESTAARPSLVDGAEQALRNWLVPGRYRTGDRLPPEHEVAVMLGISRGTLRTALQRLEESSEIVRRQGSGTFVGRMAVPAAFGERLERLEPYSSVAQRRGLELSANDLKIEHRAVGGEAGEALGPRGRRAGHDRDLAHARGERRAGCGDVRRRAPGDRPRVRGAAARRARGGADGARRADRAGDSGHLRAHARDPGAADPARAGRQAARDPRHRRRARARGADLRRTR